MLEIKKPMYKQKLKYFLFVKMGNRETKIEFPCEFCSKRFKSRNRLMRHQRKSTFESEHRYDPQICCRWNCGKKAMVVTGGRELCGEHSKKYVLCEEDFCDEWVLPHVMYCRKHDPQYVQCLLCANSNSIYPGSIIWNDSWVSVDSINSPYCRMHYVAFMEPPVLNL